MMKKTVIKRASKLWPKSERLDTAVQVLNEHEGIDFGSSARGAYIEPASPDIVADNATFKNIRDLLFAKSFTEERLISYINTKFKLKLSSIDEFQEVHINESYKIIGSQK
jgi:hypothetical protein